MKKLLIIQQDEAYFLFETLQVLEEASLSLKDYDLTVLVDESSMRTALDKVTPFLKGITTDVSSVLSSTYDISVNLSLKESSWDLHAEVDSGRKLGFWRNNGEVILDDLWSTYLLTLKSRSPYLTFHLRDIYRNILGLKGIGYVEKERNIPKVIVFGTCATHLFSVQEQENFLTEFALQFQGIPVKDISEVDLIEDVSHCLYVGPATLDALKLTDAGARGIFLTGNFQGFNLLPYSGQHTVLSTGGSVFRAGPLLRFIDSDLKNRVMNDCPYSIYTIDNTTFSGAYLKSHNKSDTSYPFYQAHLVLWSFLLNLTEVDLEVTRCSEDQLKVLKTHYEVITKFIRLHDYAMASVDKIHFEAKLSTSNADIIEGHKKNLKEIEQISDQIAAAHSLLRPFLDFYRIRRAQNFGATLLEQAQTSLLTYSEEHQALKALQELFSVTLRKNEVNI